MRIATAVSGLVVVLYALTGCGDDDAASERPDGGAGTSNASTHCGDTPPLRIGPDDGLLAIGKHAQVAARILDADHTPPAKGYNTWLVQLTDADGDGGALDDVTIESACAAMPAHPGHSQPAGDVIEQDEPGQFELSELNFFMAGIWEVQLAVKAAGATSDDTPIEYTTCDERMKRHAGSDLIVFTVCEPDE